MHVPSRLRGQRVGTGTDLLDRSELVTLLATGRDSENRIVKNLGKDDFLLQENGNPQTIRYFSQESTFR